MIETETIGQRDNQTIMNTAGKVLFFMPRCAHDHVRAVHKQAWTVLSAGYEVEIIAKEAPVKEYLGIKVSGAGRSKGVLLRPLLNSIRWFRICLSKNADVFVLRNPDSILLALMLTKAGRSVIYDSHEDFSRRPLIRESVPQYLRPLVAKIITLLERLLARRIAAVLVTQPQQVEQLGGRTHLQPNAPLLDGPIMDAARSKPQKKVPGSDTLIYVGEITEHRGIWRMLDIIERVNMTRPCRLRIAGWFTDTELQRATADHPGWQYVDFIGKVSHSESLSLIRDADVGLALLMPVADYPTTSITKIYEYMAFGTPFVASNFPAWQIERANGAPGIYVDPESADEAFGAVIRLLEDQELRRQMGEIGAEFIANEFNWNKYATRFLEIITAAQNRVSPARSG